MSLLTIITIKYHHFSPDLYFGSLFPNSIDSAVEYYFDKSIYVHANYVALMYQLTEEQAIGEKADDQ